jgi:signal recognition particle GTPase
MLSPDDASISVFEMFDQYSGGGPFRGMSCSPRLHSPVNQFEINKQAELLHQIEQLQKQLSNTKDTVKDLTAELDEVYSEKDVAINKLDRLIQAAMNEEKNEEHDQLREIRMYLTDRTEPTISSITTMKTDYIHPEVYNPFCACLRSK